MAEAAQHGSPGSGAGPVPGRDVPVLWHLPPRQKAMITAGALLALFVASVNSTLVSTALPRIVSDLGGFNELSWVFTAYMLTSTVSSPIWGKLSDAWGRKGFLVGGVLLFILTSLVSGSAQNMTQLIVSRGVQGLAGGMLMACGFTIVGDMFTPAERGRIQGLFTGVFGVSSVLGPLVGGFLTDNLSWRWAFYANVPIAVVALPVLIKVLPNVRQPTAGRIDLFGAAALSGACVPLLLAFVWAGTEYDWGSSPIVSLFAVSLMMGAVFTVVESRTTDPIMPLHLFANDTYRMTVITSFLSGFGMFGAITYVPLFVQGVIGVSATSSGTVTSPMMIGMVVSSAMAGNIVSRSGSYKALCVGGMACITAGLALLATMGADATRLEATAFMITVGFGLGAVMPILTVAAQNSVDLRYLGVVTSNLQFYRSIGGTIGVAVMGTILSNQLAANTPAPHPRLAALPPAVTDRLRDPQALVNPQIRQSLEQALTSLPGGDAILASSLEGLRLSLAESLHWTFLLGAVVAGTGFIASLFLKDVPLRRSPSRAPVAESLPPEPALLEPVPARQSLPGPDGKVGALPPGEARVVAFATNRAGEDRAWALQPSRADPDGSSPAGNAVEVSEEESWLFRV